MSGLRSSEGLLSDSVAMNVLQRWILHYLCHCDGCAGVLPMLELVDGIGHYIKILGQVECSHGFFLEFHMGREHGERESRVSGVRASSLPRVA